MQQAGLRHELGRISEEFSVDLQPLEIRKLKEETSHSIQLVEVDKLPTLRCYSWALGLDFNVDSDFIRQQVKESLFIEDPRGPLILYYDFTGGFWPNHMGRIDSQGRVKSKWGEGYIYDHGIWEVPASYGDNYKIYRIRSSLELIDLARKNHRIMSLESKNAQAL